MKIKLLRRVHGGRSNCLGFFNGFKFMCRIGVLKVLNFFGSRGDSRCYLFFFKLEGRLFKFLSLQHSFLFSQRVRFDGVLFFWLFVSCQVLKGK